MAGAFLLAIPRGAPAWAIAATITLGLPLAHVIGRALGDATGASWGMLIAIVPATVAAYVGSAVGASMQRASAAVDRRFLIGGVLIATGVVGLGPVYATLVARSQPFAWWVATLWQLVSLVAWAIAAPLILRRWHATRATADDEIGADEIISHALAIAAIAALHAVLMPTGTRLLFVPLGTVSFAGAVGWAFVAYLPLDALTYASLCAVAYAADADRRARAAAVRERGAQGELAVARLAGLRAQLRPHFLFNALNTASVLAGRGDADGARRVLTGLGELLRYVTRGTESTEPPDTGMVALRDELAFVRQYLAIERERFPERLHATVDAAPNVDDARIPALLLQPLVENAIIHGVGGRIGAGEVTVRAWAEGGVLHVTVEDDGPGPNASPNDVASGIGLANTRARLAMLYGAAATLTLDRRDAGGAIAHVALPLGTRS
jgi:signal transduction histidine kinase